MAVSNQVLKHIYISADIFPKAQDDRVDVWEDQSIGFYALENDFFAGGNAKIVGLQKVFFKASNKFCNSLTVVVIVDPHICY